MKIRFNPETQDCEMLVGGDWQPLKPTDAPGDYCAFEIPPPAPAPVPTFEQLIAWCEEFDGDPTEGWLLRVLSGEVTIDNFNRAVLTGTAPEGV